MHRSRPLLLKAGKSIGAEASKATKDATKIAASAGHGHDKTPQSPPAYPYILLHHHIQPTLFPHRQPGTLSYAVHHLSSAVGALISLCSSQENRDRFLDLTEVANDDDDDDDDDKDNNTHGSIINTNILGQSDMGVLKVLTLYQDLNNPLFGQHPMNVQEFMNGCGWALDKFHMTKDELLSKMLDVAEEERENMNGVNENNSASHDDDSNEGRTQSKSSYDFLDSANKNPDSWENALVSMTTPEMLETIKMEGIMKLMIGNLIGSEKTQIPPLAVMRNFNELNELKEYYANSGKVRLIKDDTKVMNVALLSARVEEIYPPPPSSSEQMNEKGNDDPDAPLEDVSLMPQNLDDGESKAQVVTQLEVLYELQQSSINDDGKTHTQTSVLVGKFECCLDGDPNGGELVWRLCSYRPAVEFGYFNTW